MKRFVHGNLVIVPSEYLRVKSTELPEFLYSIYENM